MSELDELEARVERDRAELAGTLDSLIEAMTPGRLTATAAKAAKGYSGEIGRQAFAASRQNPAAFALIGAGLALLLSGAGRGKKQTPVRGAAGGSPTPRPTPTALAMRASIDRGLDRLPPDGQRRVLAAREKALAAQEKVEAAAKGSKRKSLAFNAEQPLAAGALALGLGALVAGLLPGSRREDDLLGARRDALMAEARRILAEEVAALHPAPHETRYKKG